MVKKIFNVITTIILILLILVVIAVFIARMSGATPSIFGYSVFRVQTDSMEPTLMIGDVILSKKVPAEEIKVGDIITYDCLTGTLEGQTITHRVVLDPEERDGMYYFVTQGDKDGAMQDAEVSFEQVEGKYVQTLPLLDKLYTFFLSPYGLITFVFIIVALFGYEMISLVLSYKHINEYDEDYYAPKNKKKSKKRKKK